MGVFGKEIHVSPQTFQRKGQNDKPPGLNWFEGMVSYNVHLVPMDAQIIPH